jgi:hypothetical protein
MAYYFIRGNQVARKRNQYKPIDGDFFEVFSGVDDAKVAFDDYIAARQDARPAELLFEVYTFNKV